MIWMLSIVFLHLWQVISVLWHDVHIYDIYVVLKNPKITECYWFLARFFSLETMIVKHTVVCTYIYKFAVDWFSLNGKMYINKTLDSPTIRTVKDYFPNCLYREVRHKNVSGLFLNKLLSTIWINTYILNLTIKYWYYFQGIGFMLQTPDSQPTGSITAINIWDTLLSPDNMMKFTDECDLTMKGVLISLSSSLSLSIYLSIYQYIYLSIYLSLYLYLSQGSLLPWNIGDWSLMDGLPASDLSMRNVTVSELCPHKVTQKGETYVYT